MKHFPIAALLVPLIATSSVAQDDSAAQPAASEETIAVWTVEAETTAPLEALDWMVGEWIDAGDDATIVTTCSWTKNRRFLKRSFQVKIDEEVTLEGDQFVGWDPNASRIRSWTFDSEGGFGKGFWIRDGNQWLVKSSFVLANGSRASSLNVYTYVDEDTIRWQSTNREIAGELQPNIPEVTVVRQKPEDGEKEESQ